MRPATAADFALFARLYAELETGDPTPSEARWVKEIAPQTWICDEAAYIFVQRLDGAAYIRHVATAPEARRRGLGRRMMEHIRAQLRAAGVREWHLNVKPGNQAARALYEAVGMRLAYASTALRLGWEQWASFPAGGVAGPLHDLDGAEAAWDLPRGQLAHARAEGRLLFGAPDHAAVAVYDPAFPGAFPFRARGLATARALAEAIRPFGKEDFLNFVTEADPALRDAALAAGALLRMEVLHYQGEI